MVPSFTENVVFYRNLVSAVFKSGQHLARREYDGFSLCGAQGSLSGRPQPRCNPSPAERESGGWSAKSELGKRLGTGASSGRGVV